MPGQYETCPILKGSMITTLETISNWPGIMNNDLQLLSRVIKDVVKKKILHF